MATSTSAAAARSYARCSPTGRLPAHTRQRATPVPRQRRTAHVRALNERLVRQRRRPPRVPATGVRLRPEEETRNRIEATCDRARGSRVPSDGGNGILPGELILSFGPGRSTLRGGERRQQRIESL